MKVQRFNKEDLKLVTKYKVVFLNGIWKFKKDGRDKAIYSCRDKSTLITEAIYYVANHGGWIYVYKENGVFDFLLSNWFASEDNG